MFKNWMLWQIDASGFDVSLYTNFLIRRIMPKINRFGPVPPSYPGTVMSEEDGVEYQILE